MARKLLMDAGSGQWARLPESTLDRTTFDVAALVTMSPHGYQHQDLDKVVVDLVRLGLKGDRDSVRAYARRILRQDAGPNGSPGSLAALLEPLLAEPGGDQAQSLRRAKPIYEAAPVDDSSFFPLMRIDHAENAEPPFLPAAALGHIKVAILERLNPETIVRAGLKPTRTLLFTGEPGVGKTMAARYIAGQIGLPLVTVDLSAMMSSLLGKTGQNLRRALDYGQDNPCVFFLDEFDALAKSREDATDVGELKRIVNVLLQEIDRWPSTSLLLAATNHPKLLDRAVWRRFDRVIEIGLPDETARRNIIEKELHDHGFKLPQKDTELLVAATSGMSGADLARLVVEGIRDSIVGEAQSVSSALMAQAMEALRRGSEEARAAFCGIAHQQLGMTQREIGAQIGLSHVSVGKLITKWKAHLKAPAHRRVRSGG